MKKILRHKAKVKIEILSALDLIYRKRMLGAGAEGEVYHITKNVVAKVWSENWFGETTITELKKRFKRIEQILKKYPKWVKQPEFLGAEKDQNQIITYHEYIPKSKSHRKYTDKFFMKVDKGDLCDTHDGNLIENGKGLYLIDVSPCEKYP